MASDLFGSATRTREESPEVSTLELFFDLVFVFGFIQVVEFMSYNPTWIGIIRGIALLGALWWAWVTYSWLTDAIPAEEILAERLVILIAATGMFVVAVTVPGAFDEHALIFGGAYFVVRVLHVGLYTLSTDPETQRGIRRLAPGFLGGPALLIIAGFFDGIIQGALWAVALAIDYSAPYIRGNEDFTIYAEHFVERYRLIVIIALGEILIKMGFSATELSLGSRQILGIVLGMGFVITLWWLYFDYLVSAAECRLANTEGPERALRALISYSYIHFFLVGGIIFSALGIQAAIADLGSPLELIPATALYGGGALFLVGRGVFQWRETDHISVVGLIVAVAICLAIPLGIRLPALTALGFIFILFAGLVTYEVKDQKLLGTR
ncbi:MAG: low temperature requirement protein A [Halalkalicoccus sp.]|nr:low temperature requirement protein A [Halalkalicoccus sp.]